MGFPLHLIVDDKCDLISESGKKPSLEMDTKMDDHFNTCLDRLAEWRLNDGEDCSLEGMYISHAHIHTIHTTHTGAWNRDVSLYMRWTAPDSNVHTYSVHVQIMLEMCRTSHLSALIVCECFLSSDKLLQISQELQASRGYTLTEVQYSFCVCLCVCV